MSQAQYACTAVQNKHIGIKKHRARVHALQQKLS